MSLFTIMRKIEIDAAHRVPEHGSKCRNLHGHRYVIEAHCIGELASEGVQEGMVLDFGFLKEEMTRIIYNLCDHGMILRYDDPLLVKLSPDTARMATMISRGSPFFQDAEHFDGLKLHVIPFTPTAENLARHWFELLDLAVGKRSNGRAKLEKIVVHETPNCSASYPR